MDTGIGLRLAGWHDFYLVTGTAAAALTALQFVTQSLLASGPYRAAFATGDPEGGIGAFGSPTVVHFTLALVLSAVMCVPWSGPAAKMIRFSGSKAPTSGGTSSQQILAPNPRPPRNLGT